MLHLKRFLRVSITPRDGNPSKITKFQNNLTVALRPGAPEFSVEDFIWQEINNLSEDPKKICSYSPYIMYLIEKVAKTEFPKNVTHKPLKLNPSKSPRFPSPRAEWAPGHEDELFEEGATQEDQPQTGPQAVTGLTGGEAGSNTGPPYPLLRWRSFSISSLACAGVSITARWSNKGLGGQTSKWGTGWSWCTMLKGFNRLALLHLLSLHRLRYPPVRIG
jgi:hypothetical protein